MRINFPCWSGDPLHPKGSSSPWMAREGHTQGTNPSFRVLMSAPRAPVGGKRPCSPGDSRVHCTFLSHRWHAGQSGCWHGHPGAAVPSLGHTQKLAPQTFGNCTQSAVDTPCSTQEESLFCACVFKRCKHNPGLGVGLRNPLPPSGAKSARWKGRAQAPS